MDEPRPDFGPSGYLPDRAARQARKIILRAPLGLQWLVAAGVFGLVVLVAGLVFLATRTGPPAPPYEAAISLVTLERTGGVSPALGVDEVLVMAEAGPVTAYADAGTLDLQWCPSARQIEGAEGRVWSVTGRGFDGTPSLERHPVILHDGEVYVDPTARIPGPPPSDEAATSVCR